MDIKTILRPYNPWLIEGKQAFSNLPQFHRPVFERLFDELHSIPQMLSITGPRRIGKSTLLRQIIQKLFNQGIPAERLVYYSFDDPVLATPQVDIPSFFDGLMQKALDSKEEGVTYFFFDEIHRLERWELFLKKYYDLGYPIKVVISGSASSPIFKKSRESLLGRVKDYHLLPFSFREFVLFEFNKHGESWLQHEIEHIVEFGDQIKGLLTDAPNINQFGRMLEPPTDELKQELDILLDRYFLDGGFPEVWSLADWTLKQEYLYDNQITKVIYEDLVIAAEFRKPELLKRFYISLLEIPGREVSIQPLSVSLGINAQQIEKYLPLLEMTDLIHRLTKFKSTPLRLRKGAMKFYFADLALRNAAMRLTDSKQLDDTIRGLYAENLVFLALNKWKGKLQLDYYRERNTEVDFIVHLSSQKLLPIEVKYRNDPTKKEYLSGIREFLNHHGKKNKLSWLITKRWQDFDRLEFEKDVCMMFPLPLFLIMFD